MVVSRADFVALTPTPSDLPRFRTCSIRLHVSVGFFEYFGYLLCCLNWNEHILLSREPSKPASR